MMRQILWWLLAGTKGGTTRARIILAIKEMPRNANQLAELLNLDYKTIRHHLEILVENKILTATGDKYGATYFLSPAMEESYTLFHEIWEKIGKSN